MFCYILNAKFCNISVTVRQTVKRNICIRIITSIKTKKTFVYILRIAGQTAGPIGLTFFLNTHGWPGNVIGGSDARKFYLKFKLKWLVKKPFFWEILAYILTVYWEIQSTEDCWPNFVFHIWTLLKPGLVYSNM